MLRHVSQTADGNPPPMAAAVTLFGIMQIKPELIDPDADKVVRRLARHGYQAYLVGGCVRDLLLGREPKDFDVSTNATPNQIRSLFRNCRIIGRRFTLAHIFFGQKIIETSTFRATPKQDKNDGELLIRRDNVFGSETEDARRRDFTINGLFYDVEDEQVIDHVDGLVDLENRLVQTIGDPNIRFREDPVRILRAIKFAARLDFKIGAETYAAILEHRAEITKCAIPRVLEEIYRLLRGGAAVRSMELLVGTGVAAMLSTRLSALFGGGVPVPTSKPEIETDSRITDDEEAQWAATWADDFADATSTGHATGLEFGMELGPAPLELSFLSEGEPVTRARDTLNAMLAELDRLKAEGEPISNSLCLAVLTMPFVGPLIVDPDVRPPLAGGAIMEVMGPLADQLHAARRDVERARQILTSVRRLLPSKRRRSKPVTLLRRDYFADTLLAYEMYANATQRDQDDVLSYWRNLLEQQREADETTGTGRRKRRRRRRGGRPHRDQDEGPDAPSIATP